MGLGGEAYIRLVVLAGFGGCILLLSLLTVFNQVKTMGLSWQEVHYLGRLEAVAAGEAGSPWQYRVLSDGVALGLCRGAKMLGVPRAVGVTFVVIRLMQNGLIFALALLWYRRLGISVYLGLLGISALAWGMTQSNFASDLSINTYSEILFYLWAAWVITAGKGGWIPLITVLAALNRETSGLIPVLYLAVAFVRGGGRLTGRDVLLGGSALLLYAGVFFGLRGWFGVRAWVVHPSGAVQGWELFLYNVGQARSWSQLAGLFGLAPIIAVLGWRRWRGPIPAFWVALLPVWMGTHFFLSAVAETRLFLVPMVVAVLPAALMAVEPVVGEGQDG